MFALLALLVIGVGLVIGLIARAIVPGQDRMGLPGTIVLGVAGSLVGGVAGNLLVHGSGFGKRVAFTLCAVGGAVLLLLVYRAVRGMGRRPEERA